MADFRDSRKWNTVPCNYPPSRSTRLNAWRWFPRRWFSPEMVFPGEGTWEWRFSLHTWDTRRCKYQLSERLPECDWQNRKESRELTDGVGWISNKKYRENQRKLFKDNHVKKSKKKGNHHNLGEYMAILGFVEYLCSVNNEHGFNQELQKNCLQRMGEDGADQRPVIHR